MMMTVNPLQGAAYRYVSNILILQPSKRKENLIFYSFIIPTYGISHP